MRMDEAVLTVRVAARNDESEWLRMRKLLWPNHTHDELLYELQFYLGIIEPPYSPIVGPPEIAFVADRGDGNLGGFVEVSTHSRAEGCSTSPVGYLEGWWVDDDLRLHGIGRMLVNAAEKWARGLGYTEMASDTDDYRPWSVKAHQKLGYSIVSIGREILFRKLL